MDSSTLSWKRQHANGSYDLISGLPEGVIGRILSFLPTREAVRTSVLSKRWRFMWTFITDLDFDDAASSSSARKRSYKLNFLGFVHKVLHHLNDSRIQSFSLSISKNFDSSTVDAWISAALGMGVKKLSITSREKLFLYFSYHLILDKCNKSLEKLVLNLGSNSIITLPSFVCISHLKSLTLSGVAFRSSDSSEVLNFSLPVLKEFVAKSSSWQSGITFTVPLVESISLTSLFGFHLSCMRLEQSNQVQYLNLDGLEVISPKNGLADLPVFEKLRHLELCVLGVETLLGMLLRSPNLRTFIFVGVNPFDEELLKSARVPECMLSTLEVVNFERFLGPEYEVCLAKFILGNCEVLEKMNIHAERFRSNNPNGRNERVLQKKLNSFKKGSKSYQNHPTQIPRSHAIQLTRVEF